MGRSWNMAQAQDQRLSRSRFEASLETLEMLSTCWAKSSDESCLFRSSWMTKASQLKPTTINPTRPVAKRVLNLAPRAMRTQRTPATARLTHAARVNENTVPSMSHPTPMAHKTLDKEDCWLRHAMAKDGGIIMARTAP